MRMCDAIGRFAVALDSLPVVSLVKGGSKASKSDELLRSNHDYPVQAPAPPPYPNHRHAPVTLRGSVEAYLHVPAFKLISW